MVPTCWRGHKPSFAFERHAICDADIAITTSGFEADIFESGLRTGPRPSVTSPTAENGADMLGVVTNPVLHLKRHAYL